MDEAKQLASKVNALARFDAVIHNAGVYDASPEEIFTVNALSSYVPHTKTEAIDLPEFWHASGGKLKIGKLQNRR